MTTYKSAGILVPLTITDAMMSSSTIAEPAAGETAWASGGTYALGDQRIRVSTHTVYECSAAHTGRTTPPEDDGAYWFEVGPTLRWAAYDNYSDTASTQATSMQWVLRPGFFNAMQFYAMAGTTVNVLIKEAPGGAVYINTDYSLEEPPVDEYDWCFGIYRALTKLSILGLLPFPDPEVTITFTGPTVSVGVIVLGDFREFMGSGDFGGARFGASAEPVSNSYVTKKLGRTTIVRRNSGTNIRMKVQVPAEWADFALATVQQVLDTPVCLIATDRPGFLGLSGFGLVNGPVSYDSTAEANLNLTQEGLF
jgi:hypothetical protein